MAIYHLSAKIISRSSGKSAVASAAYRSRSKFHDDRQNMNFDYSKKTDLAYSEIFSPENSPSWVYDRESLWNEVEKVETRINSQVAREIEVALPCELSQKQNEELLKDFVKNEFVNRGMIADVNMHIPNRSDEEKNPHAHIMLTTREISKDGLGKKNREWNDKNHLESWREKWAEHTNKALEKANIQERIDHRSYKEQGISQLSTLHMGAKNTYLERKGIRTEIGDLNREIQEFNKQQQKLKAKKYTAKTDELPTLLKVRRQYKNEFPEIENINFKQAKILASLNFEKYGKKASVNFITQAYKILLQLRDLDQNTYKELERLEEARKYLDKLKKATSEKEVLERNIFSRMMNKEKIKDINNFIDGYKANLSYVKINNEQEYAESQNNYVENKRKLASEIKKLEPFEDAKKVVDEIKAKQRQKELKRNRHLNRYYEQEHYRNRGRGR